MVGGVAHQGSRITNFAGSVITLSFDALKICWMYTDSFCIQQDNYIILASHSKLNLQPTTEPRQLDKGIIVFMSSVDKKTVRSWVLNPLTDSGGLPIRAKRPKTIHTEAEARALINN